MPLLQQIAIAVAVVALVIVTGRYLVPRLLDRLARRNNREAFFLVAMAAVFAAAWAMDRAGMSMALGAFLMGMMLSTSRYSLQIEATLEPHKGLLMSLFFVAVGMSVDVAALAQHPFQFALHVVAIITIKVAVLYVLCLIFGTGRSTALRVAFMLSQGGEFGFVVFGAAKALGVIDDLIFVMAVAVISLTMLLTPVLVKLGNRLACARPKKRPGAFEHAFAIHRRRRIRSARGDRRLRPRRPYRGYHPGQQRHPLRRLRDRCRTGRQVAQRGPPPVLWRHR
jgi:glutathione-regulated potassium-efflux system ancillary protein KefC